MLALNDLEIRILVDNFALYGVRDNNNYSPSPLLQSNPDFMIHNSSLLRFSKGLFFGILTVILSCCSNDMPESEVAKTELKAAESGKKVVTLVEDTGGAQLIHFTDGTSLRLSSGPDGVISNLSQDSNTGDIIVILTDGTEFKFAFAGPFVSTITITGDEEYSVSSCGRITLNFTITPTTEEPTIDFSKEMDAGNFSLSPYYAGEENFRLLSVEPVLNTFDRPIPGQYKAELQELAKATGYSESISFTFIGKNYRGNEISTRSNHVCIRHIDEAEIHTITVNGVEARKAGEHTYLAKLPYYQNLERVSVKAVTSGNLSINGAEAGENTTINMSSPATLSVTTPSGKSIECTLAICYSDIPVVYVETPAPILSKDDWVKNGKLSIFTSDDDGVILNKAQYKGRGNSTWGYPKKPYAIKLDKKAEILGMPKHKRWVLLANYLDKTLMRNAVAFEVGHRMEGLDWTPHGRFVDLVFNGRFVGNYYLCEQIKIDENRVNITEMEPTDVDESSRTGGFLLEYDSYFDEVNKFRSDLKNMPVNIKEPDEEVLNSTQFNYIRYYINSLESLLAKDFTMNALSAMIDVNSFIDWWIVYELVQNAEPNHPKSSYMFKGRNDVLKAGPLWDFDWETFRDPARGQQWLIKNTIYYGDLFKNQDFVKRVKERWNKHKSKLESVTDFIDQAYAEIKESGENNGRMWTAPDYPNLEGSLSYSEAVERLRRSYVARLKWMDSQISNW